MEKRKLKLRYGRLILSLLLIIVVYFAYNSDSLTGYVSYGDMFGDSGDKILAKVNGQEITLTEIDEKYEKAGLEFQSMFGKEDLVNQTIDELLLLEQIKIKGYTIIDEELGQKLNNLKVEYGISDEDFLAFLNQQSVSLEDYLVSFKKSVQFEMLFEEVLTDIEITETEMLNYYGENSKFFNQPESVKASHVLIKLDDNSDEEALAILSEVKDKFNAGEEFGKLAKEYSECPSAVYEGDLGYFVRGQMVAEFEEAAFNAKVGELIGPVKTMFGYHLILVTDKKEEGLSDFEEVKNQIKEALISEKENELFQEYIEELRSQAEIEIYS